MKNNLLKYIVLSIVFSLVFANSRVAFSRPSTMLRSPGVLIYNEGSAPLFTAGFSTETVNFDLPSFSTSLYLHTETSGGFNLGISYTALADPRSKNAIDADSTNTYVLPTEMGLHIQKRIYSPGNIRIDLGISDVIARKVNGESEFQDPSMYVVFSSYKEFDKFSIMFNYGFGSGKVALDQQIIDFTADDNSTIKPFLGFTLFTPEISRLKNRINLLFEYDGTGISMGAKIPITNEYIISLGVVHVSEMGNFGIRSKVGESDVDVSPDAPTICFGFEMNVPKTAKKHIITNPYTKQSTLLIDDNQQVIYTQEAVDALTDSLNTIINDIKEGYDTVADSIRFLTFSLENNKIEKTSLQQKIATLEDSLHQTKNQKMIDMKNYNKASRHIAKALRFYYDQDYNKALIEIDNALEINPNLALAYARKGVIYYRLGQMQSANINLNIALKLDPEYNEVREVLEALKNNKIQPANLEEDTK